MGSWSVRRVRSGSSLSAAHRAAHRAGWRAGWPDSSACWLRRAWEERASCPGGVEWCCRSGRAAGQQRPADPFSCSTVWTPNVQRLLSAVAARPRRRNGWPLRAEHLVSPGWRPSGGRASPPARRRVLVVWRRRRCARVERGCVCSARRPGEGQLTARLAQLRALQATPTLSDHYPTRLMLPTRR